MTTSGLPRLGPLQSMRAGVQEVAYYEAGPADCDPVVVLLLHDFLYDIHSYEGVIPHALIRPDLMGAKTAARVVIHLQKRWSAWR